MTLRSIAELCGPKLCVYCLNVCLLGVIEGTQCSEPNRPPFDSALPVLCDLKQAISLHCS